MCQPGKPSPQGLSHHFTSPARFRRLPQGKVAGVALQRVRFGAHAFQQVAAEVSGKPAVLGELRNVKIDVAAGFVGVAVAHQLFHHSYHFRDVVGGPGKDVGRQDVHPLLVLEEAVGVELGDLPDGLPFGQGGHNHLVAAGLHQFLAHVAHVGDVLDVVNVQPLHHQGAANPVGHHVGAQIADVGVAVHRRPAGVHFDFAGFNGLNFVNLFRQGIVKAQQSSSTSFTSPGCSEGITIIAEPEPYAGSG